MKGMMKGVKVDHEMIQMMVEEIKDVIVVRDLQGLEIESFERFIDKIWKSILHNWQLFEDERSKGYRDAICDMAAILKGIANAYKYCKDPR
jgi:hypothetical protein